MLDYCCFFLVVVVVGFVREKMRNDEEEEGRRKIRETLKHSTANTPLQLLTTPCSATAGLASHNSPTCLVSPVWGEDSRKGDPFSYEPGLKSNITSEERGVRPRCK